MRTRITTSNNLCHTSPSGIRVILGNKNIRMTNKSDKTFLFEANLNWLAEDRGIMYAHGANGPIYVTTPAQFGGSGKEWSPEHLLLSAVIGCYMSTFISFAKKTGVDFSHLECTATGQVELAEGRFRFTHINVYPKIYITGESMRENTNKAIEKTAHYCLISNSINASIIYHTQILIEKQRIKVEKPAIAC